uniref:Uncharacterized protein n=1 Tax=Anguilla anguilla TaxID=7936 RepID=A0A0E9QH58_ANGAN
MTDCPLDQCQAQGRMGTQTMAA